MPARRWPAVVVVVVVAVGSLGLSACVADPPPIIGTAIAGDGQAVVSWQAPLAAPTPIAVYVVTPWIGPTRQTPVGLTSTATPHTVTGLTNGVTYTFTVHAVNTNGDESAESGRSNPVTPEARIPTFATTPAQAAPVFVQGQSQQVQTGTANTLAFAQNNTAGNVIVVSVLWDNLDSMNISDSRGNKYVAGAGPQTWGTGWKAKTLYATNIVGGANTVSVGFYTPITSFGTVYIAEYAGIDNAKPVDVTASGIGTSSAMTTAAATTTYPSDLLYGFGASNGGVTAPGTGFTTRSMTFGNITEDRVVSSMGSYAATATQNSTAWVMQMIAFRANPPGFSAGAFPRTMRAADLNGDGHLDVAGVGGIGVSVLLGDGTGGFGPHAEFPAGSGGPVAAAVGDVNGDGHLDLAVASNSSDGVTGMVSVLLGDGSGNFGAATDFPVLPDYATSVAMGDLNGDGFADVVATDLYDVSVLLGDGSGTNFRTTTFTSWSATDSVQIADVNGDNLPDVVVANEGLPVNCPTCRAGVWVLFGDGAGGFTGANFLPAPQVGLYSVAAADVNGDSHVDLVATNIDSNTLWVLFGDGAGNFPNQATIATGVDPSSVAVADLNSDGIADLVVTIMGSSSVSVLLGDGTGGFGSSTDFHTGDGPSSVVIGNLNGDARPDLLVTAGASSSVSVLLNTTPPIAPMAPTILHNATAADQSATISWLAPAGDGGSAITGYEITPYIGFGVQPSMTFDSTATTQTLTGLTNGTTYRFKVSAINGVGTGPQSTVTNPVTPGV